MRSNFIVCLVAIVALIAPGDEAPNSSNVVGDLRIEELRSTIFGNLRKLRILLPAGYDAPENRRRVYPVLYLNDGQNLFDSATSIFNSMEWRVDETVAGLVARKAIAPMIIVGIDNIGRTGRAHEYLPYPDEFLRPPDTNPRGGDYPEFLAKEVLPFVGSRYRVSHDRDQVGLGGSSYGGVAALYSAVKHPDLFGLVLIESPSLYVDDAHILRDVRRARFRPSRIYLGVGTNEEGKPDCDRSMKGKTEAERDVHRLEQILRENGETPKRIRVVVAPCAVHNEAAWAARLPVALEFLFGRR